MTTRDVALHLMDFYTKNPQGPFQLSRNQLKSLLYDTEETLLHRKDLDDLRKYLTGRHYHLLCTDKRYMLLYANPHTNMRPYTEEDK